MPSKPHRTGPGKIFTRKAWGGEQHIGLIAEDMPELVAMKDRSIGYLNGIPEALGEKSESSHLMASPPS